MERPFLLRVTLDMHSNLIDLNYTCGYVKTTGKISRQWITIMAKYLIFIWSKVQYHCSNYFTMACIPAKKYITGNIRLLMIFNNQLKNKPHHPHALTQHIKYFSWKYPTLLTCRHIFSELIFLASVTNFLASSFEKEKTQLRKLLSFNESKPENYEDPVLWVKWVNESRVMSQCATSYESDGGEDDGDDSKMAGKRGSFLAKPVGA